MECRVILTCEKLKKIGTRKPYLQYTYYLRPGNLPEGLIIFYKNL